MSFRMFIIAALVMASTLSMSMQTHLPFSAFSASAAADRTPPGGAVWRTTVSRADAGLTDPIYHLHVPAGECSYDAANPPFGFSIVELDGDAATTEILWMWTYDEPCRGYGSGFFCGAANCQTHVYRLSARGIEELLTIFAMEIGPAQGVTNGLRDISVGGNQVLRFNGNAYAF